MALYRFKVSFEDYDDVMREIDIKSTQTFEALHRAIHQSTGYDAEKSSSFYISNDQWTKGEEITYLPNQKRIDRGVPLMEKVKLLSFIDDPHQKFYYTFNFDSPFDFHVELIKIILDETPGIVYPAVIKSVGEAPKQFGNTPIVSPGVEDDLDFLNELEFDEEEVEAEDFTEIGETVDDREEVKKEEGDEEEEGEDEFGSEFSDDEGFEDEGKSPHGDDY